MTSRAPTTVLQLAVEWQLCVQDLDQPVFGDIMALLSETSVRGSVWKRNHQTGGVLGATQLWWHYYHMLERVLRCLVFFIHLHLNSSLALPLLAQLCIQG
jgi:hypothetical protein